MPVKFSEDVVPLTDLKLNPGRIVKHVTDAKRPVLLTSVIFVWNSVAKSESAQPKKSE